MIAYLDTNVAAWLVEGNLKKLTKEASRVIRQASLLVSPVVVLELEYMLEVRRTVVPATEMVARLSAELDLKVCNYPFPAVVQAAIHEKWTRDAFDRLIVAHARANGVAALISADAHIQANYSATVW